jgi:hypothetical protein
MILASEVRIPLWDVGASLSDKTVKTEVLCRSRCGTIKIPPCSKALSAEHRAKFAALSPVMVTAARYLKNCSRGYKQTNETFPKSHMHIFNVSITVQGLTNVSQKVWKELITLSRCRICRVTRSSSTCTFFFMENVRTLPKNHKNIFNVSITTVQGLKNVSLKVWKE